jgi:hypothetical protein
MNKVYLTDGSGCWFDGDKAISFGEDSDWDGRNMISKATGEQWDHQALNFTKSGKWILECNSQWQGSMPSWEEVNFDTASLWLINQNCLKDEEFNDLPGDVQELVCDLLAAKEV